MNHLFQLILHRTNIVFCKIKLSILFHKQPFEAMYIFCLTLGEFLSRTEFQNIASHLKLLHIHHFACSIIFLLRANICRSQSLHQPALCVTNITAWVCWNSSLLSYGSDTLHGTGMGTGNGMDTTEKIVPYPYPSVVCTVHSVKRNPSFPGACPVDGFRDGMVEWWNSTRQNHRTAGNRSGVVCLSH